MKRWGGHSSKRAFPLEHFLPGFREVRASFRHNETRFTSYLASHACDTLVAARRKHRDDPQTPWSRVDYEHTGISPHHRGRWHRTGACCHCQQVACGGCRGDVSRIARCRVARLCKEVLEHDPFGGWVFVFRNRRATAGAANSGGHRGSAARAASRKGGGR